MVTKPGGLFPTWYANHASAWLATYVQPLNPDLVIIGNGGHNDAWSLDPNDIWTVLNQIAGWTTANGWPPDVLMVTARQTSTQLAPGSGYDAGQLSDESAAVLIGSTAKVAKIGLLNYNSQAA